MPAQMSMSDRSVVRQLVLAAGGPQVDIPESGVRLPGKVDSSSDVTLDDNIKVNIKVMGRGLNSE